VSRFRKIDPKIWNDSRFLTVSDDGKFIFLFLLTHPALTSLGAMRANIPGLSAEIHWGAKRFAKGLAELLAKGMAKHCAKSSFLYLPNFIKYNMPENPNVVKGWQSAFEQLPECSLCFEMLKNVKEYVKGLGKGLYEALPKCFDNRMPNQEQEQEQEQEHPPNPPRGSCVPFQNEAKEVLQFLAQKTGHNFREVDANLSPIRARLGTEGVTVQTCRTLICRKINDWKDRPDMQQYLRPITLFSPTKFEQYLAQITDSPTKEPSNG
jgi:uncharacterized phage protein (TIGR02220 family)